MVKEADANKDADKKKREEVDARNSADGLVHATEKSLEEHGDKVTAEDKEAIQTALRSLQTALKDETDVEVIKQKTQDLSQASMKLGEAIYKSQQEAKEEPATEDKKEDDVVDAEFEEVDKK
jgi:molecular chaperone DnaK